jgi:hypothetical protein
MDSILAYIDPGSGSLVVQAVIATIIAIPFFFRQQISRFARLVRHRHDPGIDAVGDGEPGNAD